MTDIEHMYCCALRYGLGRRTYITSVISSFLLKQKLSKKCIHIMIQDIEREDNLGDECDKKNWNKLLNHLQLNQKEDEISDRSV